MPSQAYQDIKALCRSSDVPESELLPKLAAILDANPDVVYEQTVVNEEDSDDLFPGDDCGSLIFEAVWSRSPEFCRMLIEINGKLVKTKPDGVYWLPFHAACLRNNVKTAKYLVSLYPESISIPDEFGWYPLHWLCRDGSQWIQDSLELVRFLLKHDRGAVSAATPSGDLPLHLACNGLIVVKLVYDAYPEAVHVMDNYGKTPLDAARAMGNYAPVDFFETQLHYELQAREQLVPDRNGQLPIHRAILDEAVSAGTIKLMVAANPGSVLAVDNEGSTPVHLACQVGNVDKLKHLVERNEDTLQICNSRGEFPLQIACRHGRCNVINYILDKSDHGVSVNNGENKLPIQTLLFDADCDRDSLEFVEAVGRLLFAHPVNPADLVKEDD
eukprot:scaffold7595_cov49-Cyclotella_meneghiniana.AAC.2